MRIARRQWGRFPCHYGVLLLNCFLLLALGGRCLAITKVVIAPGETKFRLGSTTGPVFRPNACQYEMMQPWHYVTNPRYLYGNLATDKITGVATFLPDKHYLRSINPKLRSYSECSQDIAASLDRMQKKGYNTIRVFIEDWSCADDKNANPTNYNNNLNKAAIINVADFVTSATSRNMYVILSFGVTPNIYTDGVTTSTAVEGFNNYFMNKSFIDKEAQYVKDTLTEIKTQGGAAIFDGILGVELLNEPFFQPQFNYYKAGFLDKPDQNTPQNPWAMTSGYFQGPDGTNYDMHDYSLGTNGRQALADAWTKYWIDMLAAQAKNVVPDVNLSASLFTPNLYNGAKPYKFSGTTYQYYDGAALFNSTLDKLDSDRQPLRVKSFAESTNIKYISLNLYPVTTGTDIYDLKADLRSAEISLAGQTLKVANATLSKPMIVSECWPTKQSHDTNEELGVERMIKHEANTLGYNFAGWINFTQNDNPAGYEFCTPSGNLLRDAMASDYRPDPSERYLGIDRSTYKSTTASHSVFIHPENATDGKSDAFYSPNYWWMDDTTGQDVWIQVDLGDQYPLRNLVTVWKTYYGAGSNPDYYVQVSSNGSNFTNAMTITGVTAGRRVDQFPSNVMARYVRLLFPYKAGRNGRLEGLIAYSSTNLSENQTFLRLQETTATQPYYTATVTASYSANPYPMSNAVDNRIDSCWQSGTTGLDAWLKVDLGIVKPVNAAAISWGGAYCKSYLIETSTNGSTFSPAIAVNDGIGGQRMHRFPEGTTARYIRLTCKAPFKGASYCQLGDFSVYGFENEIDAGYRLEYGKSVACNTGAVATASGTKAGKLPSMAIDNDPVSEWQSLDNVVNPTLQVNLNLKDPISITAVMTAWGDAYATTYTLQFSNDGVSFGNTYTVTDCVGGQRFNKLPAVVSARYVKITCKGAYASGKTNYALADLSIFAPNDYNPADGSRYNMASSASSYGLDPGPYSPIQAFDGEVVNGGWVSSIPSAADEWLRIDLRRPCLVDASKIIWTVAPTHYKIEYSLDGNSFPYNYDYTMSTSNATTQSIRFSTPFKARSLRVHCLAGDSGFYALREWKVFGENLGRCNVAVTTATSSLDALHPASYAGDGLTVDSDRCLGASSWASAKGSSTSNHQVLYFTLDSLQSLEMCTILWAIPANQYSVSYSADGRTWSTISQSKATTGKRTDSISFPYNTQAKYVKIDCTTTTDQTNYKYEMYECMFYGRK